MKTVLVLSLASSALAAPSFSDFLDALFGGNDDSNVPHPSDLPNFPPIGTGSGIPFPTATGVPFPTGTSGVLPFPYPGSDYHVKPKAKVLQIDYQLAPTATVVAKKRGLNHRQLGGSALPSFSLLDPNDTPPATEPATSLPTELPGLPSGTGAPELPTGAPTDLPGPPTDLPTPPAGGPTAPIPFPTGAPTGLPGPPTGIPTPPAGGPTAPIPLPTDAPLPTAPAGTGAPGFPGLPTTFGTVTRGPRPTTAPEAPGQEEDGETENGNAWLDWINDLLTGGKGGN